MFLVYEMEYKLPGKEKPSVSLIPYSSVYQEQYKTLYNESFHRMREELGIEPFDYIQDDSYFASGMENVYLLLQDEEIIGSVAIKGDEIDDLFVNSKYRGKAYGRQIVLWAMDQMTEDHIRLHVADWNKQAISLYEDIGFEITRKKLS